LGFEYLPRQKLAELYDLASKDLLAIGANVADCERAIHEVKQRSPKTDADLCDIRFYEYFLQLNQAAKDEIVDVLTHRMHQQALRASYGASSMSFSLAFHVPWSFRWNPRRFEHSTFSSVRHAFHELPIRILREVQRLYEEQDKTQFDQHLEKYISETKPAQKIRRLLEEHHLLAARKSVLLPALEAYEREEFSFFASAAATQIEGMVEDGCLLSGISLNELRRASITNKLDALVRDTRIHIDYVYYAFKFPIVRNRIAHGRVLTRDVRRVGHLLLLDLYDCCRIVRNHPGAPNPLVELLRRVKPDMATLGDVVEFAAIYAETNGERPNPFYGLAQDFENFERLLDRQAVWDFIHELLRARHEELDIGLRFIGNRIKKKAPILRTACARLLAQLGDRGSGEFDRGEFMSAVRRHQDHDLPAGLGGGHLT
jgi:hypothetical protein